MTQIIEPNEKSDLKQDVVRRWASQAFTGVLSGFDISPGSSGFLVTIASGEAWINKVHIDDDETRIDLSLITTTPPAGGDEHWIIYGQHTPAGTFPAPPMTINAIQASPPTVPALPADSVKLADVFVPAGANDITDCTIVKAPKLSDRGSNDGETIPERLMNSNMNIMFNGGGSFDYNGTDTITWTENIDLITTTITNKEKFASVPLTAIQIVPGTLGPSPVVGPNSILFAVFDRLSPQSPATPTVTTLRVLNLDAPDAAEANAFYDPIREKIVFIGILTAGVLSLRSGFKNPFPAPITPANPPHYFLRNDPGGAHSWEFITEEMIVNLITIDAFSVTSGDPVELGDSIVNPTFSATTGNDGGDGPDVSAVLTNNSSPANSESKNVLPDFTLSAGAFNSDFTYQESGTGANGAVQFTLTVVDDTSPTPTASNVTLDWYRYTYWGSNPTDPGAGNYDDAFMALLANKALRSGKGFTLNITPPGSEFIFFAYPAWKGDVTSIIDNNTTFDITASYEKIAPDQIGITTENAANIAENYRVYKSLSPQTGNVNITVS